MAIAITISIRKHLPLLELSLRVYIAYYLFDYGIAKLTGNMFNNATPQILKTELQQVDLFHLTWYFFQKSTILSYTVGVCQMLSAVLLLFRKTVLVGCAIALPILLNIFLIDVVAFPGPQLAIRVFLYMLCVVLILAYRRDAIVRAYKQLLEDFPAFTLQKKAYLLFIPLILVLYLVLEFILVDLVSLVF